MAARPRTTPRSTPGTGGGAAALRIAAALLLPVALSLALAAPAARAQDQTVIDTVTLQTPVGSLVVELQENHPSVRPWARAWANLVRDRVFFHRSDDRVGCSADDPECFLCVCVPESVNCLGEIVGSCLFDPLFASCSETGFQRRRLREPDSVLIRSPNVLHAGRFELDENNRLVDVRGRIDALDLPDDPPVAVFQNDELTVALVRDAAGFPTGEWIINLDDNSDARIDPSLVPQDATTYDDTTAGRFVIGRVLGGSSGLLSLSELPATDARCNGDLQAACAPDAASADCQLELDQLPVIDLLRGVEVEEGETPVAPEEPELLTVCDPDEPDDTVCRMPYCTTVSENGLECVEPLCYAITLLDDPIDTGGDPITHQCDFPETPNFPLATAAQPAGVALVENGLAPPTPQNVLDFANNPQLTVDVRDVGCTDTSDPPLDCANPGSPTFFEIAPAGSALEARVSDTSRLLVRGELTLALESHHAARATLAGGTVGEIASADDSNVAVEAGEIAGGAGDPTWSLLEASTGLWTGIGPQDVPLAIDADGTSLLRVVGTDFEVDGQPVAPPTVLGNASGSLTGTLASGAPFEASFDLEVDAGIALLATGARERLRAVVTVGDEGNPSDGAGGPGSVAYPYSLAQTEVTNAEYAEFLSRAALSDPNGLWDLQMQLDARGGITRSGASGNYRYSVPLGREDWPVVFVSRDDAMRYVNWLANGGRVLQPVSTETGVYTFVGGVYDGAGRAAGARVFLPRLDEWYKAAYYDPDTATYRTFPTASDSEPASVSPDREVGNAANLDGALGDEDAPLTDASAYRFSASPYGTLDQAGNVLEWLEDGTTLYGGHWRATPDQAGKAAPIDVGGPETQQDFLGFRIPEPGSAWLGATAVAVMALLRRRRGLPSGV